MKKSKFELPKGNGFARIDKKGSCYFFMEPEVKSLGAVLLVFAGIIFIPGVLAFFETHPKDLNHLGIFIATFILIVLPLTIGGLWGVFSQPCVAILDTSIDELQIPNQFTGAVKDRRLTATLYLVVKVIEAGEDSTECGNRIVAVNAIEDPTFEVQLWYQVTGGEEHVDACLDRLKEQAQWKGVIRT